MTHHPIAATLTSAFVIPSGLFPELPVVAVSFAAVERVVGTGRLVLIALAGHVGATLVTEGAVKPFDGDLDDYASLVLRGDATTPANPYSRIGSCAGRTSSTI